jgi:hypothetical protein
MLNTVLKIILVLCGTMFVLFIGCILIVGSAFGGFDKDYSLSELTDNFEENKTEIYELKRYFNEIVPKNRFVLIEFENDNTLARLEVEALDSVAGKSNGQIFLDWNLQTNSPRTNSVIRPLGWTTETLKQLKEKLDDANCIRFQRSGLGMYSFNVFDKPIPDSLRAYYNDSCTYIMVNDKLVLEYGGGMIGDQCFYNMR